MKVLFSAILLCFVQYPYGQNEGDFSQNTEVNTGEYTIGLALDESSSFETVIDWISTQSGMDVSRTCQSHHLLSVVVDVTMFKSYDFFYSSIHAQFPTFNIFRKDDGVFSNECAGEVQKP